MPTVVDPDRWVAALDGQRFVRKVTADTHISVDDERYSGSQALVGQYVTLRVDAAAGEFVVEHHDQEVKRLPIKGLGSRPVPFAVFVERMCGEARADRLHHHGFGRQLVLPLSA